MNYTCIGSGAFGMAIASILSKKEGNHVLVWSHDETYQKTVSQTKVFQVAKKEYTLPKNIELSTNLEQCILHSNIIFLLISTPFILPMVEKLQQFNWKKKSIFIGTKGMLKISPYFLTNYLQKKLKAFYVGFFAGPNLAQDMLQNDFCSITFSIKNKQMKSILRESFRDQVILHFTKCENALELASILKNIYAIGSGILLEKTNSKTALHAYLAQSYNELIKLLDSYFFLDYDFLPIDITGDFYLTCTMEESRNLRYGRAIIQEKEEEFLKSNTVEGVENLENMFSYLQKKGANAPLFHALYEIVILKNETHILEETMRH